MRIPSISERPVVTTKVPSATLRRAFAGLSLHLPACCGVFALMLALLALSASSALAQYYPWANFAGLPGSIGSADGTGSAARFNWPYGVAVDGSGNVYIADTNNQTIRKVTPGGVVTTLAGSAGSTGSADGTGSAARFGYPSCVAVDGSGNVYVTDSSNDTIRKVTPGGVVTTLAGSAGVRGSADGTGSAAQFDNPTGIAVDGDGNVYVADNFNYTIRKVTSDGVVSTLAGSALFSGNTDGTGGAARFNFPDSVAVDGSGNVYVADTNNQTIRKVTPGGVVTTFAGSASASGSADGTSSAARFYYPHSVAVDSNGNLYVADSANNIIRKVTPAAVVTTIGGTAGVAGSSDGIGSAAQFNYPESIAVASTGTLFVADLHNHRITAGTPIFAPIITVEQPTGTSVALGGTQNMMAVMGGATSLTFTIRNSGSTNLTGLTITTDGANAADFSITASPTAPVSPGGSTTFTVQFATAAGGAVTLTETAAIHIANNVAGKDPFDINLSGPALSYTQSTGNDGMSDAAKFLLAPLGFNWQVSQPALVNTYYTNANAANLYTQTQYNTSRTAGQNDVTTAPNTYSLYTAAQYAANRTAGQNDVINSANTYSLYTLSQVQALNVNALLLAKQAGTGQFKLTLSLKKSTDLVNFAPFSFTAPQMTVNAQGQVEFLFTVPDNAAFFRVGAQ